MAHRKDKTEDKTNRTGIKWTGKDIKEENKKIDKAGQNKIKAKSERSKPDYVSYAVYGMIAVLIIFGIYAYTSDSSLFNKSMSYKYENNGNVFEVRKISDNECQIKVFFPNNPQPYIISTRYDPARLEDVNIVRPGLDAIKDDKHVYFSVDPDSNLTGKTVLAAMEMGKYISNSMFFNIPSSGAVTKHYKNKTVASCNDANQFVSVIELRLGSENKIYSERQGCIIIEGTDEEELIRGADRLALYWLGVMK